MRGGHPVGWSGASLTQELKGHTGLPGPPALLPVDHAASFCSFPPPSRFHQTSYETRSGSPVSLGWDFLMKTLVSHKT